MRWLHFILSHSIFIALCALALCYQTFALLHVPGNNKVYFFIFCSTLCSYNFYWLLSKYSFRGNKLHAAFFRQNQSYLFLFLISASGMAISLYFLEGILSYIFIAVILTLIYSIPLWPFQFTRKFRSAGFLKTTLLAFTWAYVTTIIPAAVERPLNPGAVWILFIARFFFMALLCIIFDKRDIHVDKENKLHSLATDLGGKALHIVMFFAFFFYIIAGVLLRYYFDDHEQLVAFLITGVAVYIVYRASLKPRGYIFYYFVVDGLMLFSATASFIASWFH